MLEGKLKTRNSRDCARAYSAQCLLICALKLLRKRCKCTNTRLNIDSKPSLSLWSTTVLIYISYRSRCCHTLICLHICCGWKGTMAHPPYTHAHACTHSYAHIHACIQSLTHTCTQTSLLFLTFSSSHFAGRVVCCAAQWDAIVIPLTFLCACGYVCA